MVYGSEFMVWGLWFRGLGWGENLELRGLGLWFMVYGLWFMVYGLWFMVYYL